MLYTSFKFIHVVGAIVWVGGSLVLAMTTIRFLREEGSSDVTPLVRQNAFVGQYALGPSAAVTLMAGIMLMVVGKWPPTLWIVGGFLGCSSRELWVRACSSGSSGKWPPAATRGKRAHAWGGSRRSTSSSSYPSWPRWSSSRRSGDMLSGVLDK